jgi:hypothetical protein
VSIDWNERQKNRDCVMDTIAFANGLDGVGSAVHGTLVMCAFGFEGQTNAQVLPTTRKEWFIHNVRISYAIKKREKNSGFGSARQNSAILATRTDSPTEKKTKNK